jgi:hypothetical protein
MGGSLVEVTHSQVLLSRIIDLPLGISFSFVRDDIFNHPRKALGVDQGETSALLSSCGR